MNNNNKGGGGGGLKEMGRGGGINFLPLKRVGSLERDLLEKGGGLNRGFTVYVLLLAECRHTMTSLLLQSPKTRSFFFPSGRRL